MKSILRSMKLWQKFGALGALSAVMCAVPLMKVIEYRNGEIAVAKGEEAGIDPARTLVELEKSLQFHRGLTALVLGGNAAADSDRRTREAEVNVQIAQLIKQAGEVGYDKVVDDGKDIKAAWEKLEQQVNARGISAAESFTAHSALVTRTIDSLERVADVSGLSLDPMSDSYYVMTAVFT